MERGVTGLLRPCAAGCIVVYGIGSRRGYRPGCSRHDREAADQRSRVKRKLKVLDFVKSGGPHQARLRTERESKALIYSKRPRP